MTGEHDTGRHDKAGYQQIASELRQLIVSGQYPPGIALPSERKLMEQYGVARPTIRAALQELRAEGLIMGERGAGVFVRKRPTQRRITRDRRVHQDEIGYYFDPQAKNWTAITTPRLYWSTATPEIARLLEVALNSEILVRERHMGESGRVLQVASSYLPGALVRGTQLEQANTGPGGIYARMEDMGHQLEWTEHVTARMPTPDEIRLLRLDAGVPVLRILRQTWNEHRQVLEVNDTRMSADEFEVAYDLEPIEAFEQRRTPTKEDGQR